MSRPLDLDLLTAGCEIWTSTERWRDPDGMPVGGVIVEIHDDVDPETGEVVRRFRCLDTHRSGGDPLACPLLREADLDPATFKPPGRNKLSNCIRRLAGWILKGRGTPPRRDPKLGALSPQEVQWAHWIGALAHAIEQRQVEP